MLTDDEIAAMLENITPGPWRYEAGGGHAPNSIRGSDSVQVHGWKERAQLPGGGSIGNASYSDRVCADLGDIQHGGPSYNVALICAAPDIARELLAAREVVKAARGVANCGTCICAPALPLEQALARYDNAIKKQETSA